MFLQKMQIRILLIILAVIAHSSEASVCQEALDSVGLMPEVTVTAPRYEYQDEAWLGMVEGVVVEARQPPSGIKRFVARDGSQEKVNGNMSSEDIEASSMHLLYPEYLLILFMLATLSISYVVIHMFLTTKEVKHDKPEP